MSDAVEGIQAFNQTRDKKLRSIKYEMMRDSRFAFFRGTCHLFFKDWPQQSILNDTPAVWIVGDLHPQNFAVYRGDDGQIYFDINDFDDALLAPCAWDVARCLTSLYVAFTKPTEEGHKQVAELYLASYIAALKKGNPRNIQITTAPEAIQKWMKKRSKREIEILFNKYCNNKRTALKTITKAYETSPLPEAERKHVLTLFNKCATSQPNADTLRLVDADARIGGISSIGLERYLLLVGDSNIPQSSRLLEIKQRIASALAPFVTQKQPDWSNEAARVAALQQRLQAVQANQLQVITHLKKSYTVRELEPVQEKTPLGSFEKMADLRQLAETLGKLTAWAHLRGCGRQGAATADVLIALAAESVWQTDIFNYAAGYAKQVASDFKTFRKSKLGANS